MLNMISCFLLLLCVSSAAAADGSYEYEDTNRNWPVAHPVCGGSRQSPIDISNAMDVTPHPEFMKLYRPPIASTKDVCNNTVDGVTFTNNGKVLQLDLGGRGWLVSSSLLPSIQHVLQVHHHAPSEHTIEGTSYPLELHFVTAPYQSGPLSAATDLVVFGYLFEEGAADPFLATLLDAGIPELDGETIVNFIPFLEMGDSFYEYEGSLTTPPCWENVRWHVSTVVRTASSEQIDAIRAIRGENPTNNRPTQPRFGRKILKRRYTTGPMSKAYDMSKKENMPEGGGAPGPCGGGGSPITINFEAARP